MQNDDNGGTQAIDIYKYFLHLNNFRHVHQYAVW